jgi:hypothetical protein
MKQQQHACMHAHTNIRAWYVPFGLEQAGDTRMSGLKIQLQLSQLWGCAAADTNRR